MKKSALILILSLTALISVQGTGHPDSSQDSLGDFHSLSIEVPAKTELVRGSRCTVDITMSEGHTSQLDVYTDRGTLIIRSRGGWIRKSDEISIRITMPRWETIKLNSSGILSSTDYWNLDYALIRNTGSGEINIQGLNAMKMECRASGSGRIRIEELATELSTEIHISGSGDYLGSNIRTDELVIKQTGSGSLRSGISVEKLSASLSGSGDLRVSGRCGRANLQTTGSGKILGDRLDSHEAWIRISGSGDVLLRDGVRLREIRMTGSGTFRSL